MVTTIVTALAVLLLAGLLLWLGYELAMHMLREQRGELQQRRHVLDAEWKALENTRRVRELFLAARRAMQRQADVPRRPGTEKSWP